MKKREARKKLIHFPKEKSSGDASQANFDLSKESFLFIYSFVALKNALSKKTTRDGLVKKGTLLFLLHSRAKERR